MEEQIDSGVCHWSASDEAELIAGFVSLLNAWRKGDTRRCAYFADLLREHGVLALFEIEGGPRERSEGDRV